MEYSTCPRCGKLFMRLNKPICPACEKEEEKAFDELRDYLEAHPDQPMVVVSENTGVPMRRILQYIRDGRIEMTMGIADENPLKCLRCGTPILIGTYCTACHIKYTQDVQGMMMESASSKKASGMHHLPKRGEGKSK
jgi:uncharacterized Zn finger protein (UPF0148 family)